MSFTKTYWVVRDRATGMFITGQKSATPHLYNSKNIAAAARRNNYVRQTLEDGTWRYRKETDIELDARLEFIPVLLTPTFPPTQ